MSVTWLPSPMAWRWELLQLPQPIAAALAEPVAAKEQVEQSAKDRDGHNGHDPGDFVVRVVAAGDNPDHCGKGEHNAGGVKIDKVVGEHQNHRSQHSDLQQDKQHVKEQPVGQHPGNALEYRVLGLLDPLACVFAHLITTFSSPSSSRSSRISDV